MKTYSTKSNARRAAKNAGIQEDQIVLFEKDGRWTFEEAPTPEEMEILLPSDEEEEELPAGEETMERLHDGSATGEEVTKPIRRKSIVDWPTQLVWEVADQMFNDAAKEGRKLRRKDVITKCVELGIAFYTARTQYQLWKQATLGNND